MKTNAIFFSPLAMIWLSSVKNAAGVLLAGVSYALREKASIWQKLNEITSPICIYHDALIGRRYCVENFGQFAEYWIHLFDLHAYPRPSSRSEEHTSELQ